KLPPRLGSLWSSLRRFGFFFPVRGRSDRQQRWLRVFGHRAVTATPRRKRTANMRRGVRLSSPLAMLTGRSPGAATSEIKQVIMMTRTGSIAW
ncbi:unnamed protein product, partial [Musa acuminata subsp. burmannicoides]